jgi:hypothetical protein
LCGPRRRASSKKSLRLFLLLIRHTELVSASSVLAVMPNPVLRPYGAGPFQHLFLPFVMLNLFQHLLLKIKTDPEINSG